MTALPGLVDAEGGFLPHLLPVDQTLHWANPPGGTAGCDGHGNDQTPYREPVPIVTRLHGGYSTDDNDGFPEDLVSAGGAQHPGGVGRAIEAHETWAAADGRPWSTVPLPFCQALLSSSVLRKTRA